MSGTKDLFRLTDTIWVASSTNLNCFPRFPVRICKFSRTEDGWTVITQLRMYRTFCRRLLQWTLIHMLQCNSLKKTFINNYKIVLQQFFFGFYFWSQSLALLSANLSTIYFAMNLMLLLLHVLVQTKPGIEHYILWRLKYKKIQMDAKHIITQEVYLESCPAKRRVQTRPECRIFFWGKHIS